MKKKLHFLFALFLGSFNLIAQTSIPNPGFEDWNNYTWMDPTNYQTANDQLVPMGLSATVIRTSDAYHGNFALQMTTGKVGTDTVPAYITNSVNNPNQGVGGIPYSQKATGIRFHYKCNVVSKDTALIFAVFKNKGKIVGSYLYPITGNVTTYTLFAKTFSPALSGTPDSVIFALTSSNIINGGNGIPGSMLQVDSVSFTGVTSQPLLLDGDFENWQTTTEYYPAGWTVQYPGALQTTDAFAGKYALELITQGPNSNNNQVQPGTATTGSNNNNFGGYPFTNETDTLELNYKYAPADSKDSATVQLNFRKSGAFIGGSQFYLPAATKYTLIKFGFNIGSVPDSVIVTLNSSKTYNPPLSFVGSDLKVDNIHFKSQPLTLGIESLNGTDGIKLYPNPAKDLFYLDTHGITGTIRNLAIYDMGGQLIESRNYSSGLRNTVESFDLKQYAAGLYLMRVNTDTAVYYQKLQKVN